MENDRIKEACCTCRHYIGHWGKQEERWEFMTPRFYQLNSGHCTNKRTKLVRAWGLCGSYERKD